MRGVRSAISGYAGGHVDNPSYEQARAGAPTRAMLDQRVAQQNYKQCSKLAQFRFKTAAAGVRQEDGPCGGGKGHF